MAYETKSTIRARKISDLVNFYDIYKNTDIDDAWIVLAYNKNNERGNYKVSLGDIVDLVVNECLDESVIRRKVEEILDDLDLGTKYDKKFKDIEDKLNDLIKNGGTGNCNCGDKIKGLEDRIKQLEDNKHECDCADKIKSLEDRIKHLEELLDSGVTPPPPPTPETYVITIVTDNHLSVTNKTIEVTEGDSVSIPFSIDAAYELNNVVLNPDTSYEVKNNIITINNVQDNITVTITSKPIEYTLTVNATNLSYTVSPQLSKYTVESGNITIKFNAELPYILPESVNVQNATIVTTYNSETGVVVIRCSGKGNMTVSAIADVQVEPVKTIKFGICCTGVDAEQILDIRQLLDDNNEPYYEPNSEPCQITYNEKNFFTEGEYPFEVGKAYNFPSTKYGAEDSYIFVIMPKAFFHYGGTGIKESYFLDKDSNPCGFTLIYPSVLPASKPLGRHIWEGVMDGEEYYIIDFSHGNEVSKNAIYFAPVTIAPEQPEEPENVVFGVCCTGVDAEDILDIKLINDDGDIYFEPKSIPCKITYNEDNFYTEGEYPFEIGKPYPFASNKYGNEDSYIFIIMPKEYFYYGGPGISESYYLNKDKEPCGIKLTYPSPLPAARPLGRHIWEGIMDGKEYYIVDFSHGNFVSSKNIYFDTVPAVLNEYDDNMFGICCTGVDADEILQLEKFEDDGEVWYNPKTPVSQITYRDENFYNEDGTPFYVDKKYEIPEEYGAEDSYIFLIVPEKAFNYAGPGTERSNFIDGDGNAVGYNIMPRGVIPAQYPLGRHIWEGKLGNDKYYIIDISHGNELNKKEIYFYE